MRSHYRTFLSTAGELEVAMNNDRIDVLVLDQGQGVWGAQRYLLRLAPLLAQQNIFLSLGSPVSLSFHQAWKDSGWFATQVDLPVQRSIRSNGRISLIKTIKMALGIQKSSQEIALVAQLGKFDAIMANSHWIHLDAAIAGRLSGVPTILHLHEESIKGFGSLLRQLAILIAKHTVSVSNAIVQNYSRPINSRVSVIPNGIDAATFLNDSSSDDESMLLRKEMGISSESILVLAVTRIDPSKKIEDIILAYQSVNEEHDAVLVIVGSTSDYEDYQDEVKTLAEEVDQGRIIFCGHRDDVSRFMHAADILIHAGMVEGMPLGLLEAQACGLPLVAYSAAGVAESVIDGESGILVAPGDVQGLGAGLQRLIRDPEKRKKMGKYGSNHVLEHHSIKKQSDLNAKIIRDTVLQFKNKKLP
ncbi:MAG: glycosyltransferase family 4 protein [Mycobacteriaceae bacterium]